MSERTRDFFIGALLFLACLHMLLLYLPSQSRHSLRFVYLLLGD